jgi:uncharacterized protein (DUF983 family)
MAKGDEKMGEHKSLGTETKHAGGCPKCGAGAALCVKVNTFRRCQQCGAQFETERPMGVGAPHILPDRN